MELGLWMNNKQDRAQLKKSVVQSVLLCLSCFFMDILTSKFITNWEKKLSKKKKIKSLNFAESNVHRKTNACCSFETYNLCFLALHEFNIKKYLNNYCNFQIVDGM